MDHGFVYEGQRSNFRHRRHGAPATALEPSRFVDFVQNHDQVGNRAEGERLSSLVKPEQVRLAAALVALAPGTPLIFMGEEYAESAPFAYFIDHGDQALVEAVRRGRAEEHGRSEVDALDPADPETFERCILDHHLRHEPGHREIWSLYQSLLVLRASEPALRRSDRAWTAARSEGAVVTLVRAHGETTVAVLFNLGPSDATGFLPEHDARIIWDEPLAMAHQGDPKVELAPWQFRLFRASGGRF
jgi:maltooligosyltrehalose trehalohydrolase